MKPEDEQELRRAVAEHKAAQEWEFAAREGLYACIQRILRQGDRGSIFEEVKLLVPFGRRRLQEIKAGRWHKHADKESS